MRRLYDLWLFTTLLVLGGPGLSTSWTRLGGHLRPLPFPLLLRPLTSTTSSSSSSSSSSSTGSTHYYGGKTAVWTRRPIARKDWRAARSGSRRLRCQGRHTGGVGGFTKKDLNDSKPTNGARAAAHSSTTHPSADKSGEEASQEEEQYFQQEEEEEPSSLDRFRNAFHPTHLFGESDGDDDLNEDDLQEKPIQIELPTPDPLGPEVPKTYTYEELEEHHTTTTKSSFITGGGKQQDDEEVHDWEHRVRTELNREAGLGIGDPDPDTLSEEDTVETDSDWACEAALHEVDIIKWLKSRIRCEADMKAYREYLLDRRSPREIWTDKYLNGLSRTIGSSYSEERQLRKLGDLVSKNITDTSGNDDQLLGPFEWLKRRKELAQDDAIMDDFHQDLCKQIQQYQTFPFFPETDHEFALLKQENARPANFWTLNVAQHAFGYYSTLPEFRKLFLHHGNTNQAFVMYGALAGLFSGVLLYPTPIPKVLSHLFTTLFGAAVAWIWQQDTLAQGPGEVIQDAMGIYAGYQLHRKRNATALREELIQLGEQELQISPDQLHWELRHIFTKSLYTSTTNRNYTAMYTTELPDLAILRCVANLTATEYFRAVHDTHYEFINNYQVPLGRGFLYGLDYFFRRQRNSRRSFIDKIAYTGHMLNKHLAPPSERRMGMEQLAEFFRLREPWLRERVRNLTREAYETRLDLLYPSNASSELWMERTPLPFPLLSTNISADGQIVLNGTLGIDNQGRRVNVTKTDLTAGWREELGLVNWVVEEVHWNIYRREIDSIVEQRSQSDRFHLSDADQGKVDAMIHSLGLDASKANKAIENHTTPTFRSSVVAYIDKCGNSTAQPQDLSELGECAKDMRMSSIGVLQCLTQLVEAKAASLKQIIRRFYQLNNSVMMATVAYKLLAVYKELPGLVRALRCGNKRRALERLQTRMLGEEDREDSNSILEFQTARAVGRALLEDQFRRWHQWDAETIAVWAQLTGVDIRFLEYERLDICALDVEQAVVRQQKEQHLTSDVSTPEAADELATKQRNTHLREVRKRLRLSTKDLTDICRDIYIEKLKKFCPNESIPSLEARSKLLRIRGFVGLYQSDVADLHAAQCRECFRTAFVESLGDDGKISTFVQKQLDELQSLLLLSNAAVERIKLAGYYDLAKRRLAPSLAYNFDKLSMRKEDLQRKYKTDQGQDPFALAPTNLGFSTSSSFMEACMQTITFFTEHKLFLSHKKFEGEKTAGMSTPVKRLMNTTRHQYIVAFSFGAILDEAMRKKMFEQFMIQWFTAQRGSASREAYLRSSPQMASILGFNHTSMTEQVTSLGLTIYKRYLGKVFAAKDRLDKDDREALLSVQLDFQLSNSDCEQAVKEAREDKLKTFFKENIGTRKWTVEKGEKLRSMAVALGLDMFDVLQIGDGERIEWFSVELKAWVKSVDEVDEDLANEAILVICRKLGLDTWIVEQTVDIVGHEMASFHLLECVKTIKSRKYEYIEDEARSLLKWRYVIGKGWDERSVGRDVVRVHDRAKLESVLILYASQVFEDEITRRERIQDLAEVLEIPDAVETALSSGGGVHLH